MGQVLKPESHSTAMLSVILMVSVPMVPTLMLMADTTVTTLLVAGASSHQHVSTPAATYVISQIHKRSADAEPKAEADAEAAAAYYGGYYGRGYGYGHGYYGLGYRGYYGGYYGRGYGYGRGYFYG